MRVIRLVLFAVIAMLLLAACGGQAAPASAPAASNQVSVVVKEWAIEPKNLTAKAGDVTFSIKNTGNIEHDFSIEGTGKSDAILAAETKTLKVNLKPGTYNIICSLSGHKEAGMEGKLVVVP